MEVNVRDRNGRELEYGDEVEFWCRNERGDMDWVKAKIVQIKYVQDEKSVLKLLLSKMYLGKYRQYGHTVWASKLDNIRKI